MIFPRTTSIKKTDYPLLQKGVKRTKKTVTLETEILVIRKMKAGEKRANVCSYLGLAPATISTIMAKGEKIKQSAQKATKLRASNVSYTRNFNIEKMGQLLTLWVDDLNKKRIHLTRRAIAAKARSLFDEIQQKEGGNETFTASKEWFARFKQCSQIHCTKISGEAAGADMRTTRALESHSQPLSKEEHYDLAQQLTEKQKEDEDEDRGTKAMQKKDLTDILTAIDIAVEKLRDIDPDWERSSTVKGNIRAMLHPYCEILQKKKKKSKQLTLHSFLMSSAPRPGPSPGK